MPAILFLEPPAPMPPPAATGPPGILNEDALGRAGKNA